MLNVAVTLYGSGVALRLQTATAATVILIPVYMVLFMTPVFVPRHSLTPWLISTAALLVGGAWLRIEARAFHRVWEGLMTELAPPRVAA